MKNRKDLFIEIHSKYRDAIKVYKGFAIKKGSLFYNSTKLFFYNENRIFTCGMYLDWWVTWIKATPWRISFLNDDELLYSHPLAFCNLVYKKKRYRIGFDLWDKYPIYASHQIANNKVYEKSVIERWKICDLYFKTNDFDAKSPFRYRAPLGYVSKEEDKGRELAEEAYHAKNVFPAGMPLFFGWNFVSGGYKSFIRKKRENDLISSISTLKKFSPIRNKMVNLVTSKFDQPNHTKEYSGYLNKLGNTKISIDYPSNSRFTFRTSESLAMGALLLGPPGCNVYPKEVKIEECMVNCKEDLSDFLDKIDYFLVHDKEREEIAYLGMKMWENLMSPQNLSKDWLNTAIQYLELF